MAGLETYLVAYSAGFGDRTVLGRKALRLIEACKEATGSQPTPVMKSADNLFVLLAISADPAADVYGAIAKRLGRDFELGDRPSADRLLVSEIASAVASDSTVMAAFAFHKGAAVRQA